MRFTYFRSIWDNVFTESNIKAGFRKTGLYPVNRAAYPEHVLNPDLLAIYKIKHPELYGAAPIHRDATPINTPSKQPSTADHHESPAGPAPRPRLLFEAPFTVDEDLPSLNEDASFVDASPNLSVSLPLNISGSDSLPVSRPSSSMAHDTPRTSTPQSTSKRDFVQLLGRFSQKERD